MQETNFSSLNISESLLKNLKQIGYYKMTPIQAVSLPIILDNKDVIAQAKTGSGKTAAFGIGLLTKLNVKQFSVQSIVLCPTRELAHQVAQELRTLARTTHNIKILTLCGGTAFWPQTNSLKHGAHIIVATPGRILKHLQKEILILNNLKIIVLDEADKMLDMGFSEDIEKIINFTPQTRQTLLFSATFSDEILKISSVFQKNAVSVQTASQEEVNDVTQNFYDITDVDKNDALLILLSHYQPQNTIIFCNQKITTDILASWLQKKGVDALAMHGDLEQYQRDDTLIQFVNKSARVLVATDVAARGIDIKELSMVINYDLPQDIQTYTHRIGRTARAGKKGLACTLYRADKNSDEYQDEAHLFKDINKLKIDTNFSMKSLFITIVIEGGKKNKLRAGDILGALTADKKVESKNIGKIDIYDKQSYVAITAKKIDEAYRQLQNGGIKGKKFSIWILN